MRALELRWGGTSTCEGGGERLIGGEHANGTTRKCGYVFMMQRTNEQWMHIAKFERTTFEPKGRYSSAEFDQLPFIGFNGG